MGETMRWDLSHSVERDDPKWILEKLDEMVIEAQKIHEQYFNEIKNFDFSSLEIFLELLDSFTLRYEGVVNYCSLKYAADSTENTSKQLNDALRNSGTKTGQHFAFIELELGELLKEKPQLIQSNELKEYRHFLEKIQRRTPHMLNEAEERLVIAKDKNGISAWSQLQSDWLSTRTYKIKIDGEEVTMPYGEIISLYQSPVREQRREANRVVYEDLGKDEIIWSSALRSICGDFLTICEWRKYESPMTSSLIANDVDGKTIEALMKTISNNVEVYRRYLKLKSKLMGLSNLGNWDILAPLPNMPDKTYTWQESRKIVVDSYSGFDPEWGGWVDEMYELQHIDGEVRKGKESGAFCSSWLSGRSAFILQSFNGRIGDVYTQAHELGHAIHAYLYSRYQKPSNCEIGSCIAECGSIFGELLLTDKLLAEAKTKEEKQAVLANILDEFGMTAFQVSARAWFEQSMYDAIKKGQFLDGEAISNLWTAARDKIYGDAVEWLPEMKWEWTMKQHYYIPNYRFYNYPYVFAQLFVFALYRLYKEQGQGFIPKLRAILAAGSSSSPSELAKEIGLDISDESFWTNGIKQAEEFIGQLESTVNQ